MGRIWKHKRDDGGSMLATVIVIVGGAGLGCFLCMAANSSELLQGGIAIAALIAIVQIVRYRYARNTSSKLGLFFFIQKRPNDDGLAAQYRPRKIKDRRSQADTGDNKPITAEEARQIQVTSANTWVPTKATAEKNFGQD